MSNRRKSKSKIKKPATTERLAPIPNSHTTEELREAIQHARTDADKALSSLNVHSDDSLRETARAVDRVTKILLALQYKSEELQAKLQNASEPRTPVSKSKNKTRSKKPIEISGRKDVFPGDCCQKCGQFLKEECYSTNKKASRVPRNNKICTSCYSLLTQGEQHLWKKYTYRPGHEAKAVGWNPDKPYKKIQES